MNVDVLSTRLGVDIEPQLLELALTHRSFGEYGNKPNNERLEFLGDSVLGVAIAAHIFKAFPRLSESDLSKIKHVAQSTATLAKAARAVDLGSFLRLSRGADVEGARENPSILADTFEALIGATFVSMGMETAFRLIETHIFPVFDDVDKLLEEYDPKQSLFERTRLFEKGEPIYVNTHDGPVHARTFFSSVTVDGVVLGSSTARTKKLAETQAAIEALAKLPKPSARQKAK